MNPKWNVREVDHKGFIKQVHDLVYLYHPDMLFFMETKVSSNNARVTIKKFNFYIPFFVEIWPSGFTGGLWIL